MNVYGELKRAQAENLASDPSAGVEGRFWYNTVSKIFKFSTDTKILSIAGGGGGASLEWNVDNGTPVEIENSVKVQMFAPLSDLDGAQVNKVFFKVPESYNTGSQIKLYINRYSPGNTGTALIQAITYLVRVGTDAVGSTTNSHASGNTATAVSGTVEVPQKIEIPLTSATGSINGVSVSPGDLLRIHLDRGTDTSTDIIRVLTSSEVTIS